MNYHKHQIIRQLEKNLKANNIEYKTFRIGGPSVFRIVVNITGIQMVLIFENKGAGIEAYRLVSVPVRVSDRIRVSFSHDFSLPNLGARLLALEFISLQVANQVFEVPKNCQVHQIAIRLTVQNWDGRRVA